LLTPQRPRGREMLKTSHSRTRQSSCRGNIVEKSERRVGTTGERFLESSASATESGDASRAGQRVLLFLIARNAKRPGTTRGVPGRSRFRRGRPVEVYRGASPGRRVRARAPGPRPYRANPAPGARPVRGACERGGRTPWWRARA